MIRFIHTADIHFGMENYGRIDAKTGIHTRLLDFEKALNSCIDYTIDHAFDFFLFSGDAYKTINPSPTQQRLLMRCFLRLYKAGIPIIIVVGNHDNPLSFGKATTLDIFGELPVQGFHVFSKPSWQLLQTKSGPVQIVGIPWPSRSNIAMNSSHAFKSNTALTDYISQSVETIIKKLAQKLDPAIPSVLAAHITVSTGIFSGSEKRAIYGTDPILLPSQLAIEPFDYVALGHLHRYQNLNPDGYPAIIYSGSIERIDFGERKEEKGFCAVTIKEKGITEHKFIKTPMRPFLQLEVHLKPNLDQTYQLIEAIQQHDITDAIIKIIYYVPAQTKDTVDLQKVIQSCNAALHVVSITPVRALEVREKRALINNNADFESIISHYFSSKTDYKDKKELLTRKATELYAQIYEEQEQE